MAPWKGSDGSGFCSPALICARTVIDTSASSSLTDGRVSIRLADGREIRLRPEEIAQARLVVEMADLREDFKRSRAAAKGDHGDSVERSESWG